MMSHMVCSVDSFDHNKPTIAVVDAMSFECKKKLDNISL